MVYKMCMERKLIAHIGSGIHIIQTISTATRLQKFFHLNQYVIMNYITFRGEETALMLIPRKRNIALLDLGFSLGTPTGWNNC